MAPFLLPTKNENYNSRTEQLDYDVMAELQRLISGLSNTTLLLEGGG